MGRDRRPPAARRIQHARQVGPAVGAFQLEKHARRFGAEHGARPAIGPRVTGASLGEDVRRAGIPGTALEEDARRAGHLLDRLAHRPGVVRRQAPVFPGHDDRVAGVVHQGRQRALVGVVEAQHPHRAVDESGRVAADDDAALRRSQAAVSSPGSIGRCQRRPAPAVARAAPARPPRATLPGSAATYGAISSPPSATQVGASEGPEWACVAETRTAARGTPVSEVTASRRASASGNGSNSRSRSIMITVLSVTASRSASTVAYRGISTPSARECSCAPQITGVMPTGGVISARAMPARSRGSWLLTNGSALPTVARSEAAGANQRRRCPRDRPVASL